MWKKYKNIILMSITMIILSGIFLYFNLIDMSVLTDVGNESLHFNLITTNSVIAGFMFSSLSLMIGLSSTKTIRRMERASFMDGIYNNITIGIYASILSILISLSMIFIRPNIPLNVIEYLEEREIMYILKQGVPMVEVLSMLIGIGCFVLAVIDTKFIVKSVRKNHRININKEDVKKTLEMIDK